MRTSLAMLAALATLAAPAMAHHGRGATYDMKRQVSLEGTVADVGWHNPHIVILAGGRQIMSRERGDNPLD